MNANGLPEFAVTWDRLPEDDVFEAIVRGLDAQGIVVLRGFMPIDRVEAMAAAYQPQLEHALDLRARGVSASFRGGDRHHLNIPAVESARNPLVIASARRHPLVQRLLDRLFSARWTYGQSQVECALPGCAAMLWHTDAYPPDLSRAKRVIRASLQVPLIDVTDAHGPLEVDLGSHTMHMNQWRLAGGGAPLRPCRVLTRRGDAILRDGDIVHRGTPNVSTEARPMASQIYFSTVPTAWREISPQRMIRYARSRIMRKVRATLRRG